MERRELGLDRQGGRGVVRLRPPAQMLTDRTARELVDTVEELVEDRSVRVVVLHPEGPDFWAGGDAALEPLSVDPDPAAALAQLRVPTISVIAGRCRSVGLELALATDIRIATPDSTFGLADIEQGRLPCWGGTQRLPRAVGASRATAMVLLGDVIDAPSAAAAGLVHSVCPDPDVMLDETITQLLGAGPLALELVKEAVHRGSELPLRDGLRLEGDLNHQLAVTEDRAEGLQAFFDKRPPDFAGR